MKEVKELQLLNKALQKEVVARESRTEGYCAIERNRKAHVASLEEQASAKLIH